MPSCFRLMPGLDDEVMTRTPVAAPPTTMLMAAVSLSDWTKTPPARRRFAAMYSPSSFWGVMG